MPAGTYRWDFDERHPPIVFDIPPGVELIYGGMVFGRREQGHPDSGSIGFGIQNANRTAGLGIDAEYRRSWNRGFSPDSYDQAIDEAFDRIVESLWAEER